MKIRIVKKIYNRYKAVEKIKDASNKNDKRETIDRGRKYIILVYCLLIWEIGMSKYFQNILEAVGNTPMIKLQRMCGPEDAQVLVKMEALNVGGSIKSRSSIFMIEAAERQGLLSPNSIIVEPTSGNQGIGLAMVGAVKGYKVILVMPDSVSVERRLLMEHYGAEVIFRPDHGNIGDVINDCLETALNMAKEYPKVFIPQQFINTNNVKAHRDQTGKEILNQVDVSIEAFCSGIGTGGTITGVGTTLRSAYPDIKIVAVEPENGAILTGGNVGSHIQMGIGDGLIPEILDTKIYDEITIVSDSEAIETSRRLAREEGICVGISSGSNVFVALKLARELGKGKTVVTILPDTAERYFSTKLFPNNE
ncbi:MAG: cysteine synthase A [Cytophagales bacterium]|nr:cysteine synthase A [Cytophagales bacterium]